MLQPAPAAAAGPQHARLFKPDGVISQFVQNDRLVEGHRGAHLLLSDLHSTAALPAGMMAIGRLDRDSEGLLLLTTDGRLLLRCVDSWRGPPPILVLRPRLRGASDGRAFSLCRARPERDSRRSCAACAALLHPGATTSQRAGRWRRSTTRRSWVRSRPPRCNSSRQVRVRVRVRVRVKVTK